MAAYTNVPSSDKQAYSRIIVYLAIIPCNTTQRKRYNCPNCQPLEWIPLFSFYPSAVEFSPTGSALYLVFSCWSSPHWYGCRYPHVLAAWKICRVSVTTSWRYRNLTSVSSRGVSLLRSLYTANADRFFPGMLYTTVVINFIVTAVHVEGQSLPPLAMETVIVNTSLQRWTRATVRV